MWRSLVLMLCSTFFATPVLPRDFAAIDAWVEQEMRKHLVPGASLIVIRDGVEVHARGFGRARGDAQMTADTPVIIGSLSKMFTATAVLQLVEQRKIELDAPVRRYVPEFTLADAGAAAGITVRDLLNQTSGLPAEAARAKNDGAPLRDHVLALATVQPAAKRATRHIYSSPNYQVLGYLVERVSGIPFAEYLRRHIFAPLGMTRTFTAVAPARAAGLAAGHNIWFGLPGPSSYRHEAGRLPTASIITTARDLSRFVLSHLGIGPQILSPASLALAHRGALPGAGFKYAMGWREGETGGEKSLWHGGALPSYRGAVVLLPQEKSAVIVLTNSASIFADHTREIASGIVAMEHGRQPQQMFRPLRQIYMIVAAAAVLLIVLQVRGIVRVLGGRARRKSVPSVVAFDILLPAAVLMALPKMTKISWRGMYEAAPDIVSVMIFILVLSLIQGGLRVVRRHRAPAQAAVLP